jgi:Fe-S oxidoreductase
MLGHAKRLFENVLLTLDQEITDGVPMVVPEPSCCASFRDELTQMLPHDQQAQRLAKQTFSLGEFLQKYAPDAELPQLARKALVQKHCHHQSVMGFDAEKEVLERLGVDADLPDTGCCGLAGSWGFEREKYDVSMECGERVLFPKVREASPETVIVADGFSCRTQIEQGTERRAVHLAQLIRGGSPDGPQLPGERPERVFEGTPAGQQTPGVRRTAVTAAAFTAAAVAAGAAVRRRTHA